MDEIPGGMRLARQVPTCQQRRGHQAAEKKDWPDELRELSPDDEAGDRGTQDKQIDESVADSGRHEERLEEATPRLVDVSEVLPTGAHGRTLGSHGARTSNRTGRWSGPGTFHPEKRIESSIAVSSIASRPAARQAAFVDQPSGIVNDKGGSSVRANSLASNMALPALSGGSISGVSST